MNRRGLLLLPALFLGSGLLGSSLFWRRFLRSGLLGYFLGSGFLRRRLSDSLFGSGLFRSSLLGDSLLRSSLLRGSLLRSRLRRSFFGSSRRRRRNCLLWSSLFSDRLGHRLLRWRLGDFLDHHDRFRHRYGRRNRDRWRLFFFVVVNSIITQIVVHVNVRPFFVIV